MAFSLNRIMLIGNLGRDAETRMSQNNVGITSFSIATTNSYKGKDGEWVNDTTWHNVVLFNASDYMKEALKKGAKFYVEGRLTKRDYTDKEGVKRFTAEVVADKLFPLDSRESVAREESPIGESSPEPSVENNDDLPF